MVNISDEDSHGVEIVPDTDIHSSDSDCDDDILLEDLMCDIVTKESRKTRSTRNEAKLKNEILAEEIKNEKPPNKKKRFDVSDIQFVPFKRKPKLTPKPKPKITPTWKIKVTKKKEDG